MSILYLRVWQNGAISFTHEEEMSFIENLWKLQGIGFYVFSSFRIVFSRTVLAEGRGLKIFIDIGGYIIPKIIALNINS